MAQHKRDLQLSFDYVTCERCEEQRLLTRSCVRCGREPEQDEIQPDLLRRVRLVEQFGESRAVPGVPSVGDIDQLELQVDHVTRKVERALGKASRRGEDPKELIAAFFDLDHLVLSWQVPQPRPDRNRGRLIGRALGQLRDGYEKFLAAMCAVDMMEAQRFESEGNAEIKIGEVHLGRIEELLWAGEITQEGDPLQVANRAGRAIRDRLGNPSTMEQLELELRRIEGANSLGEGSGIEHEMMRVMALTQFDFDRYISIRDDVGGVLEKSETFSDLASIGDWRREHARARANLSGGLSAAHLVMSSEDSASLDVANGAVQSVANLRDGVLRHAVATLVARHRSEYESFTNKSGGKVLKAAETRFPGIPIGEGLSPNLRNAGGHGGVDLDGDEVIIQGESLSVEQFVDAYLAYMETVFAVWDGLVLALSRLGSSVSTTEYLSRRDAKSAITAGIGVLGVECSSVEMREDSLGLYIRGAEPDWLQLAAFISGIEVVESRWLRVEMDNDSGTRAFVADLGVFRNANYSAAAAGEIDNALLVATVLAGCVLDDVSLWFEQDWSAVLSKLTSGARAGDLGAWVRDLKAFRGLAIKVGDDVVAEECLSAIRSLRGACALRACGDSKASTSD